MTHKTKIILLLIILIAAFFRLLGLDWDQGQHLHPDERFLTMVVSAMEVPKSLSDYLNPNVSPMNPYNLNFSFFVYGTFPLFLTRTVGEIISKTDYWNVHLVGRFLSALFDLGTVFLLFKIGQKMFNEKSGLLGAFIYSIMVLPIQLSHFFAVDTFLNFFLVLSFLILLKIPNTKYRILNTILLGFSFGCALACKISALYFIPIIGLGYLYLIFPLKKITFIKLLKIFCSGIIFLLVSAIVYRLLQPSVFTTGNFLDWSINPQFIKNIEELKSYNTPDSWFPPAVQWHSAKPIIFPLKNMVLWGMGLPLGIISLVSLFYSLFRRQKYSVFLAIFWILGLFIYQGIQFCTSMRYFLPIYPFFAILSTVFLSKLNKKFLILIIITSLIYPISFLSIYLHPITRVTASGWIYKNIPAGSTVTYEEWDDGLPLGLPNYPPANFKTESLMMYEFDSVEKWQKINEKLAKVDYIFLTSNRAYGSTMKLPEKYPQTTKYYQDLFNGTGQFKKVAEFTSRPCFPPIGNHWFCFNDDNAEEAFTVYDHPKVMIFKKK